MMTTEDKTPSLMDTIEKLRELSGGAWDDVDPVAYVRELRGQDPETGEDLWMVVDRLKAALADATARAERAERERDALIEAWPVGVESSRVGHHYDNHDGSPAYCVRDAAGIPQRYPTKAEAVRAAAHLDTTATEQPAQGEGE